jgi:hypothetical protein
MIAPTGIAQQNGQLPHDTRPKTCQGGKIAEIYDTSTIRSTVRRSRMELFQPRFTGGLCPTRSTGVEEAQIIVIPSGDRAARRRPVAGATLFLQLRSPAGSPSAT